jgi:hypothetical protein
LLLHEFDQIKARDCHCVANIWNPGPTKVSAQCLLSHYDTSACASQRYDKRVSTTATATNTNKPGMTCEYLTGFGLHIGTQWQEKSRLRFGPLEHLVLTLSELIAYDVNAPNALVSDHRFDIRPKRGECHRRQKVSAPVQQRTGVEGVEDHGLHRAP